MSFRKLARTAIPAWISAIAGVLGLALAAAQAQVNILPDWIAPAGQIVGTIVGVVCIGLLLITARRAQARVAELEEVGAETDRAIEGHAAELDELNSAAELLSDRIGRATTLANDRAADLVKLRAELAEARGAAEGHKHQIAGILEAAHNDNQLVRAEAAAEVDIAQAEVHELQESLDAARARFERLRRDSLHPEVVDIEIRKGKQRGECLVMMRIRIRASELALPPGDRVTLVSCSIGLPYPAHEISLPDAVARWSDPQRITGHAWDFTTSVRVGDGRTRSLQEFLEERGMPRSIAASVTGRLRVIPLREDRAGDDLERAFTVELHGPYVQASVEWPST